MQQPNNGSSSSVPSQLIDHFGRQVTYLRLSITDRCNLRCQYCMPETGVEPIQHTHVLSYEELERLCGIFVGLGVSKLRITGGEPFVRRGCLEFLERLRKNHPETQLYVTTNGVALLPHLSALKRLGINGINLSLDSLDANRYEEITRRDDLGRVLDVLAEILRLKIPLKVNCVVQTDTPDSDIIELATLVRENPIALRFIELMPFSGKGEPSVNSTDSLLKRLHNLFPGLSEVTTNRVETAKRFSLPDCAGTLGIIEGESRKFCATCNKVRITSNGVLKNCLYDEGVLDLRQLLRSTMTDAEIAMTICQSVNRKLRDGFEAARLKKQATEDSMASIGG